MLALITGAGRLPALLREHLAASGTPFLWAALDASEPADMTISLPTLGSDLAALKARGVTTLCMAGSLDRRTLSLGAPDAATKPLAARLAQAMQSGDDAALKIVLAIFEDHGFAIQGAHQVMPHLLPATGVLTRAQPTPADQTDANLAQTLTQTLGPLDVGQACVVVGGQVLAIEAAPGTDAMLDTVTTYREGALRGGVLFKAQKPGQDRRADLPTIGPGTITAVKSAGLAGVVIEAGGVMVLDLAEALARANEAGLFVWVREAQS